MEKETRRILMNTEEFGLLSILKDFKQKPIEMDQQSKKSAGLLTLSMPGQKLLK